MTTPNFKRRFLGAASWTGLSRAASAGLQIVVTIVLARLLQPEDYGLIAMATVVTGLALPLQDFGFGAALIQRAKVTQENQDFAFTMALGLATVIYLALFIAAGPIGAFYQDVRMVPILRVIALTIPLTAFNVVPRALMRREMTMRGEALASTLSVLPEAAVAVSLAWAGFGPWALVAGRLVGALSQSVGLWLARPWRPRLRLRGGDGRSILRFGGGVTLSNYLWYAYSNLDFMMVGRWLGSGPLGLYNMAWSISKMPMDRVWSAVTPVLVPAFSRARSDREELGRLLGRMTRYTCLATFPMLAGLCVVAGDAVRIILGPDWAGAAAPLRWLCIYVLARSTVIVLPQLLVAVDQLKILLVFHIACLVFLPLGFFAGLQFGPAGVAAAWAIIYPTLALVWLVPRSLASVGLAFGTYFRTMFRPAAATALMVLAVLAVGWTLPWDGGVRLAIQIVVGAFVYLALIWALERAIVTEVRSLVHDTLKGISEQR